MQEKHCTKAKKCLVKWMKENKFSTTNVASRLDVCYTVVYFWLLETYRPNLDMAIALEKLSTGAVRCIDWERGSGLAPKKPTHHAKQNPRKTHVQTKNSD